VNRLVIAVAEGALTDLDEVATALGEDVTIVSGPVATPADVAELTADADALVVTLQPVSAGHIAALGPRVRAIGRAGVGVDTIDLDAARNGGVAVINQPQYASSEVADHAVALLMAAHRRIVQADSAMRRGEWPSASMLGSVPALADSTLGILGCGRIGRLVIERMRPMVGRIVGYDPIDVPTDLKVSVATSAEDLLCVSDLLSLHLPLTPDTYHILGSSALRLLPQGALVVNVSRGGLVDADALAAALHGGHIRAAGLDVFEDEPLPDDSPLLSAPNISLSPHIAWFSDASSGRLARWTLSDTLGYLRAGAVVHGSLATSMREANSQHQPIGGAVAPVTLGTAACGDTTRLAGGHEGEQSE